MGAIGPDAIAVNDQRMIVDGEPVLFGDLLLTFLDGVVVELFYVPALNANDVIVMLAAVELENRLTAFEIMARHQTGTFELGEHPVHSGQADFLSPLEQRAVHILGVHVLVGIRFQYFEDFDAWQRDLEARVTDFFVFHHLDHQTRNKFQDRATRTADSGEQRQRDLPPFSGLPAGRHMYQAVAYIPPDA